jgi:hypothetical protein
MFEQIRDFPAEYAEPVELAGHLQAGLLPAIVAAPAQPEWRRFELPPGIWVGMLASYAVFFTAITLATGGSGRAVFAIVISVLYTAMFFGLARIIARQGGPDARSPLLRGDALPTWCGPMEARAVYGQILIVPLAVALFGLGIAVICAAIL